MKIVDMYDGFMVLEIHWTEAVHVVEALKEYDPEESRDGLAVDSLATAFEAGTYAGKLQVSAELIAAEDIQMSRFRCRLGLRGDWAHGFEVARDMHDRRAARKSTTDAPVAS